MAYRFPDADGAPQSGMALLLPAEDGSLWSANLRVDTGGVNLLAEDADPHYSLVTQMLGTFAPLPADAIVAPVVEQVPTVEPPTETEVPPTVEQPTETEVPPTVEQTPAGEQTPGDGISAFEPRVGTTGGRPYGGEPATCQIRCRAPFSPKASIWRSCQGVSHRDTPRSIPHLAHLAEAILNCTS